MLYDALKENTTLAKLSLAREKHVIFVKEKNKELLHVSMNRYQHWKSEYNLSDEFTKDSKTQHFGFQLFEEITSPLKATAIIHGNINEQRALA